MNRLIEEFREINRRPISNCGITIGLINKNDYRLWKVSILGPKDTPYYLGLFFMNIKFPEEYPLKAPIAYFTTPIYHLNINPKAPKSPGDLPLGSVSISTLSCWKPEIKMREVLINIFVLFFKTNPDSPYGLDRAKEFRENRKAYDEKIKYFTKKYAHPMKANIIYDRNKDWDFNLNFIKRK